MGVPLNHPLNNGTFHCNPSSYGGTTIYGNPHLMRFDKIREYLRIQNVQSDLYENSVDFDDLLTHA
jgi:hypothetical protein